MTWFIHTADWQVGKPFARVEDAEKRALLRNERIEVVRRIGRLAAAQRAEFVLVAGDLFDGATPDKNTVSAVCSAIGSIGLPVLAIPGNHDHAGPAGIWEQEFFLREQRALAGNLRVLLKAEPVEQSGTTILPCPLSRRQQTEDPTAWLRDPALPASLNPDRPRIVLAHGSVQGFSSGADEDEPALQPNLIALDSLPTDAFDYIALGDWHGAKQVAPSAWYAGTPELDRFIKGGDHDPGHVLLVEVRGRGRPPTVSKLRTARFNWWSEEFSLGGADSVAALRARLAELLGARAQSDLLELNLRGSLGLRENNELQSFLDSLRSRLLRLKLDNRVQVLPSDEEVQALTQRAADPLIAALADELRAADDSPLTRQAFRELYALVAAQEGRHAP
jgi:DNA repair exonuclease SbcCD nuclease subunit